MEVKQTGHCLLIIPPHTHYKSFQVKGSKTRQRVLGVFFLNTPMISKLQNNFCRSLQKKN